MQGFVFGGNTGIEGPEELASRRKVAEALMRSGTQGAPRSLGQGLTAVAQALSGRWAYNRLEGEEAAGRASAESAYKPISDALSNKTVPSGEDLNSAIANPWLNDSQKDLVQTLYKKQLGLDGSTKFGLNPVWGKDANGNSVLFQLPQDGTNPQQVQFPNGVTPTPTLSYHDLGTSVGAFNPKTGVQVTSTPKDVAGAAQQTAVGKGVGEAVVNLPKAEEAANMMLSSIDSLDNDPYLPSMVGPVAGKWLPNVSADSHRVQSKMDQIRGQGFLQAYQTLRGGGQITEVEGAKAEAAIMRLNTAQSLEDYKAALGELRTIVTGALSRSRTQAGAPPPADGGNDFSTDPQFGQVVNGFKIGKTARNPQTGEVLTWDGNGWRQ